MISETVSNPDLCALMDGECAPAARERIEAALSLSPQCAERLALWRRNDAALRFAVAGSPVAGLVHTESAPRAGGSPPPAERENRAESALLRRNARAATIAAVAGGAGAGALALAILLLSQ